MLDGLKLEHELPTIPAERDALLRSMVSERVQTGISPDLLATVLRLRADLLPADVADVAKIMHANDLLKSVPATGVSSATGPQVALEAARDALANVAPADPALAKLAEETRELVDRNLARINGTKGPVAGYSNYTDLAEVGRVGSNVALHERTWNAANPSVPITVTSTPASTAGADPVVGTEVLSW
jgi:hypothetical protein